MDKLLLEKVRAIQSTIGNYIHHQGDSPFSDPAYAELIEKWDQRNQDTLEEWYESITAA